jgi:hypothetical protein
MKEGMKSMQNIVQERVNLIVGDIIEPLDMYINHHDQTSSL